MIYNFDTLTERRQTESVKWGLYPQDILPLWVADMDFISPHPVTQALKQRVEHSVFGYPIPPDEIYQLIIDRLDRLYQWKIEKEDIVILPGVVTGFNLACHSIGIPGAGVLIQTPVYPPFFNAPQNAGMKKLEMQLTRYDDGSYGVNMEEFEACLLDGARMFILCNPHNPVGKVFSRQELEQMADLCLKHDVIICSDEIHCDLLFQGVKHTPIASIHPDIAQKTITLMSPSKTYNIAGLEFSVAIIQNPELRERYEAAKQGLVGHVNLMGYIAGLAAYRDGQDWLDQVLQYLEANRDTVYDFVHQELDGRIKMKKPDGTYLAWLDCSQAQIRGNPQKFFLENAKVAMNDGLTFGKGGENFVRLNFACPRELLEEALHKIKKSLDSFL